MNKIDLQNGGWIRSNKNSSWIRGHQVTVTPLTANLAPEPNRKEKKKENRNHNSWSWPRGPVTWVGCGRLGNLMVAVAAIAYCVTGFFPYFKKIEANQQTRKRGFYSTCQDLCQERNRTSQSVLKRPAKRRHMPHGKPSWGLFNALH